jgi:DNA-binding PadR family transcriptional regulator
MSSLTPTARVILGLLATGAETGYEIKQIADVSTRFFWGASYGQIYPELRRLEQAGLVRGEEQPRGNVPRRVYQLTARGRAALESWLRSDDWVFDIRDEGLLRLFFSDLLDEETVLSQLRERAAWFAGVADHIRSVRPRIDEDSRMLSVWRYGVELMEWNADWYTRLEQSLRKKGR